MSYVHYRSRHSDYAPRVEEFSKRIEVLKAKVASLERDLHDASTHWALLKPFAAQHAGKLRTDLVRERAALAAAIRERMALVPDVHILRARYWEMRATPRVLDVWVEGELLRILTDVLFGKDTSGTWRRVGPFDISANLGHFGSSPHDSNTVPGLRWRNLEGAKKHKGQQYQAPLRICGDNMTTSCLGEAKLPIYEALRCANDPALVAILVRIPECPGQDDDITLWPRVDISKVPQWYLDTFGA